MNADSAARLQCPEQPLCEGCLPPCSHRLLLLFETVRVGIDASPRMLQFVIIFMLACAPLASFQTGYASTDPVTYVAGADVSADDATAVQEGITLARNYLMDELGFLPEIPLTVNIRNTNDTTGSHSVAFFSPGFLAVFIGSPGWARISPFDRIHVVAHEYIHAFQYAVAGERGYQLPSWLIEGMAEYLSYDAVAKQGLVRTSEVMDFHAWAVASQIRMDDLSELETSDSFYSAVGPVYSLAYLAIDRLMSERPVATLYFLVKLVGSAIEWTDAFQLLFSRSPAAFYQDFAEYRDDLVAPVDNPAAFDTVKPRHNESSIAVYSESWHIGVADQLTVIARTEPGSICELRVRGLADESPATRTTVADGAGKLFWLVTVPADADRDLVQMTASCGGTRTVIDLPSTQSWPEMTGRNINSIDQPGR